MLRGLTLCTITPAPHSSQGSSWIWVAIWAGSIWRLPHPAGGQRGHLHRASTSLLSFALGSSGFKRWPLSCPRDARCIAATKTHAKQTAPDDTACGHTCFTTFLLWRGGKEQKITQRRQVFHSQAEWGGRKSELLFIGPRWPSVLSRSRIKLVVLNASYVGGCSENVDLISAW